jgi:uncharacterized protein YndB with AHSA1/START domain
MRTATWVHYIAATREQVWRALTDPALTAQYYFGLTVACGWRPGAPITYALPGAPAGAAIGGHLVHLEPGRAIVHSLDEADAWVSWFVDEPEPGLCRVTLVHDELDPAGADDAWNRLLSGLKTVLETGRAMAA